MNPPTTGLGADGGVGGEVGGDPNQSMKRKRRTKSIGRGGTPINDCTAIAAGGMVQPSQPQPVQQPVQPVQQPVQQAQAHQPIQPSQPSQPVQPVQSASPKRLAKPFEADPLLSIAALDADQVNKLVRRPPPKPKGMSQIAYVPLVSNKDKDGSTIPHEGIRRMDKRRTALLTLARNTSAINTLWKLHLMPRTVIPKIFKKPMIWVLLSTFAVGAALQRFGSFTDIQLGEAVRS